MFTCGSGSASAPGPRPAVLTTHLTMSPLVRFLRFLGKVQFTMLLLLVGILTMAIGTVIESRSGADAA